jgi:hypothetical protein
MTNQSDEHGAELIAAVQAADADIRAIWAEWDYLPRLTSGGIAKPIRDAFWARLEQAHTRRAATADRYFGYLEGREDTPPGDRLSAMLNQAQQRLGRNIHTIMLSVFDADGFRWNRPKTRQAIAAALRAVPDGTDFADMITWAITAVYTEHDFPHNPDTVRQAVGRQLAAPGDP